MGAGKAWQAASGSMTQEQYRCFWSQVIKNLEALASYGWVDTRTVEGTDPCPRFQADLEHMIHPNRDVSALLAND